MTKLLETPMSRRNILQAATAGALTIAPALRAAVYAQGSDKPEFEKRGPSPFFKVIVWLFLVASLGLVLWGMIR
jgi:hypothetical protein